MKFLFELFLLGIIVYFVKLLMEPPKPTERPMGRTPPPSGPAMADELVKDPRCGVYVPKGQALRGPDGQYYCSEDCLNGKSPTEPAG